MYVWVEVPLFVLAYSELSYINVLVSARPIDQLLRPMLFSVYSANSMPVKILRHKNCSAGRTAESMQHQSID